MRTKLDFKNISGFIHAAMNSAGKGEGKKTQAIQELIEETKDSLSGDSSHVGEWEDLELHQAHTLLDAGYPRLAAISVGKAIAINNLSPEEYAFGFAIVHKQTRAISNMEITRASGRVIQQDTAKDLQTSESLVAAHLAEIQEETARRLLERQVGAASELEQKNRDDAHDLLLIQEKALEALQDGEKKIVSHMHDLEQTLSWMAGGYTQEIMPAGSVFDDIYRNIQETQKETARLLKKHQESVASELKKHQMHLAANLMSSEKSDAVDLKEEQETTAARLKEKQDITAIKKAHTDKDTTS